MTTEDMENEMFDHLGKGDAMAIDFAKRAVGYFHMADDVIDEKPDAEFVIKTFVVGQDLYCHPFFVRHAHALNAVIRMCISTYADSVAWERSNDPAKREWADYARHAGLELLLAVADICGGWDHRREVSREWREYYLARAKAEKSLRTATKEEGN